MKGRQFIASSFLGIGLAVAAQAPALADSISPTTINATIPVGGSVTVHKTVTVSAGTPTTAQGDVFFLIDTTGSMGGLISSVKTNASTILTGLAGYGNIQTGVGNYKDYPQDPWGSPGDYPYALNSAIGIAANTQAGINTLSASGGNDYPEANIEALNRVATEAATGWRTGSQRFVLWFGDAPGHDPSPTNTPGYPGVLTATATTNLQANGIKVYAFDLGGLDDYGQATSIASATGGAYQAGLGTNIADTIIAAIGTGFSNYTKVALDIPTLLGLDISVVPTGYTGTYDRSIERTFGFDVTFTGLTAGTYDFDIFGTVDGGRVATERDHIVVGEGGTQVPEPGTILLLSAGLVGLGLYGRKRIQK